MCVGIDPATNGYDLKVDKFWDVFVQQDGTETFNAISHSQITNPALVFLDNCVGGICSLQLIFLGRFFAELHPPPIHVRGSVALVPASSDRRILSNHNTGIEIAPHLLELEVNVSRGDEPSSNIIFVVCLIALLYGVTAFLVYRIIHGRETKDERIIMLDFEDQQSARIDEDKV